MQNLTTEQVETRHISALKPFYFDPDIIDPKEVAMHDDQETIVARVLWHEGDITRKREVMFKVEWRGIPIADNDLLIPWSELRNNPALHQYLREQNMQQHIPNEHKTQEERQRRPRAQALAANNGLQQQ